MKIPLLIFIGFTIVLGLYIFFSKKEKNTSFISQKKSSYQNSPIIPSDIIFQSEDQTVKIVLKTDENEDMTVQTEIYIKDKPLSVGGKPILFSINKSSGKLPTQKHILKKIYLIATSTDFLIPFVSSNHFKRRILLRIYAIRAKNIQRKIAHIIQKLDPELFKNLKKSQDMELKMTKILLEHTHNIEQTIQQQRQQYHHKNDRIEDIETAISNESMVNILPEKELQSRRMLDKNERS